MKQVNWYQIFGQTHTIPDGRTVTPTDDIQIWLNCADIWDKTYTTLAEVLADTTTLSALINSENAVDYMVRSTTWASGVSADSSAMTYIGQNNYCANTLLADATWCEAICNSEYFESVLNVKVPAMTGYTTPEGVASAKSESGSYLAWKAFDRNDSTYWQCVDNSWPQWIQYKFVSSVKVYLASAWWGIRYPTQLKIQGSNDSSTWTDLTDTLSGGGTNRTDKYIVTSPSDYLYYRLNVIQGSASQYNVYSNAIQFYGREDV